VSVITGVVALALGGGGSLAQTLLGPASARQAGLGNAFAAVSDDAGGVFSNPAGMVQAERSEMLATGQLNSEAQEYGHLVVLQPAHDRLSATALAYRNLKTKSSVAPFRTQAFSYAFGQRVSPQASFGASINWVKGEDELAGLSDTGYSVDVGVMVDLPLVVPPFGRAVAAAVINNLNEPTVMANKLRRRTTIAAALRGEQSVGTIEVANVFNEPGPEREVRLGYELALAAGLKGRVGFITEGQIVTFGFSYGRGPFKVDYGLQSVSADEKINLLSASLSF